MALDKLVDSSQLDADLTTVADAIRTKGGTSEQLSFPDGMAQAIADLPSGGSLPSVISKIDGGSFTFETSTLSTTPIQHSLGVQPVGVAIWAENETDLAYRRIIFASIYKIRQGERTVVRASVVPNGTNLEYRNGNLTESADISLSATQFCINDGATYYQSGITYKWLAWA